VPAPPVMLPVGRCERPSFGTGVGHGRGRARTRSGRPAAAGCAAAVTVGQQTRQRSSPLRSVLRRRDFRLYLLSFTTSRLGDFLYLGEIGLVERVPRTATVTTAGDAVLWRIPGALFLEAVADGPGASSSLLAGIGTRLARTPPRAG
jgi:hypothetical protein